MKVLLKLINLNGQRVSSADPNAKITYLINSTVESDVKVLLKRFPLNGTTISISPADQTDKLIIHVSP